MSDTETTLTDRPRAWDRAPRERLLHAFRLVPSIVDVSHVTGISRTTIYHHLREDSELAAAAAAMRARARQCPLCGQPRPEASGD